MSQQKEFSNIFETLKGLDRRIMKLEASLDKIESEIDYSDHKIELIENKSGRALSSLNKKTVNIKNNLRIINSKIIKSVDIIRHLANKKDFKLLNEKLRHMKIDEQVTSKDIKIMVESRLEKEKESLEY